MNGPSVSPNEVYALQPQRVDRALDFLNGCYYQHIPEVDLWGIPDAANQRVEGRIIRHVDYDFRRYWRLATVWLDDRPVMIVQNAGREGDDHAQRFITDPAAYIEMVAYLRSLVPAEEVLDVIDPTLPRDDLISFYNDGMRWPIDAEALHG